MSAEHHRDELLSALVAISHPPLLQAAHDEELLAWLERLEEAALAVDDAEAWSSAFGAGKEQRSVDRRIVDCLEAMQSHARHLHHELVRRERKLSLEEQVSREHPLGMAQNARGRASLLTLHFVGASLRHSSCTARNNATAAQIGGVVLGGAALALLGRFGSSKR